MLMMLLAAALYAAAGAAATAAVPAPSSAPVTVYTHGEGGFPCIRIPSTLPIPATHGGTATLLAFAVRRARPRHDDLARCLAWLEALA